MTDLFCIWFHSPELFEPSHWLTVAQEHRIWHLARKGHTVEALADLYHVTRYTVRQIVKGDIHERHTVIRMRNSQRTRYDRTRLHR